MNASLQAIKDDIQADINSKHNPAANPLLVRAGDEAAILNDIVDAVQVLYSQTAPPPPGVEWVDAPDSPTFGSGTITETASIIKVSGNTRNVPGATLSQPLAATGMHRMDVVVVAYDPLTPDAEYEIIYGAEVANTETVATPSIPENRLLVRQVLVKQAGVSLQPTFYINAVSLNGGTPALPDVTGKVDLDLSHKADKLLSINTRTASYVLALTDGGGMVRMNVATANTLTIPPNSSVSFPIGTQMVLSQSGAGQTTIVAGAGVIINSTGNKLKFAAQYAPATLIKVDTDTWALYGNLTT